MLDLTNCDSCYLTSICGAQYNLIWICDKKPKKEIGFFVARNNCFFLKNENTIAFSKSYQYEMKYTTRGLYGLNYFNY